MRKNVSLKICVISVMILLLGASVVTSNDITNTLTKKSDYGKESTAFETPTAWLEQTKLLASDGTSEDYFGTSVAIDDGYAFIGAPQDDDNGVDSGTVYVYKLDGGTWIEDDQLYPSDAEAGDLFGRSVYVDGGYLVIGSPEDDDNGIESGSAYIFELDGSTWVEQDKLLAGDGSQGDHFGKSVCINGDYALIGTPWIDDAGGNSGCAYVFKRDGSNWNQQAKLSASDAAQDDNFGTAVSIDGQYALIGSFWDNDDGVHSGSAYIFERSGSTWTQQEKLTASNAAAGDHFGASVSIDGESALIGAPDDHDDFGYAYIFQKDGSNWNEEQYFTASDIELGDAFGQRVALDEDIALIGAYGADEPEDSGSAYIFSYDGVNWNEVTRIDASDETAEDAYGNSVSIDGEYVLIGSFRDDDNGIDSGSAYIFKLYSLPVVFLFGLISDVEEYNEEFMKFTPTFLIMLNSDKLINTEGSIVIKNGYLGILNQPFAFAIGRAAVIN